MEKLNFKNKGEVGAFPVTPKIMNDLQDNVESAITEVDTKVTNNTSEIEKRTGTVIWTNSKPTIAFPSETLNLSIGKNDIVEIITNNNSYRGRAGCFITMSKFQDSNGSYTGDWYIDVRTASISENSIVFSDNRGQSTRNNNDYSIRNTFNIPLAIILYKH